jgi:predicted HTH transcriptional regulator
MDKKISLDDLSFSELEKKVEELRNKKEDVSTVKDDPWIVGKKYLIRTVTMTLAGTLHAVYPQELVLDHAVWVADTGRFMQATEKGEFN